MKLRDFRAHRNDLIGLWSEAFGDSEDFISLIFEFPGDELSVFARFENDRLVSALYALKIDLRLDGRPYHGLYIYACATESAFRGRGFMGELLEECRDFAKAQGEDFLCLVPAEPSLCGYYSRFGFKKAMSRSFLSFEPNGDEECADFRQVSAETYFSLRTGMAKNAMFWSGSSLEYIKRAYSFFKTAYYSGDGFAFAFGPEDGSILEFLSKEPEKNEARLASVCRTLGLKGVSLFSPEAGEKQPFGMILPLSGKLKLNDENIYMNFALD